MTDDYWLTGVARRLSLLGTTADRARTRFDHAPVSGSPLAELYASIDDYAAKAIRNGVHVAMLRLIAVEDHLAALARTITDEKIVYASYSIARSAAEIAAWAWWLLDPALPAVTRTQRCLSDRFHSLNELQRGGIVDASDRIEQFHRDTVEAGYELRPGAYGAWTTDEVRPSSTRLMETIYAPYQETPIGGPIYKLLSAFTHGTGYALAQFVEADEPADADGMLTGQVMTTVGQEATVVALALMPYTVAVQSQFPLHGWTDPRFGGLMENLNAVVLKQMQQQ